MGEVRPAHLHTGSASPQEWWPRFQGVCVASLSPPGYLRAAFRACSSLDEHPFASGCVLPSCLFCSSASRLHCHRYKLYQAPSSSQCLFCTFRLFCLALLLWWRWISVSLTGHQEKNATSVSLLETWTLSKVYDFQLFVHIHKQTQFRCSEISLPWVIQNPQLKDVEHSTCVHGARVVKDSAICRGFYPLVLFVSFLEHSLPSFPFSTTTEA